MTPKPMVIDISHHNPVSSFRMVAASGIRGVIHKATQGTHVTDEMYDHRRATALACGLLFGAYHFGNGSDPEAQVEHFLSVAKPDAKTLVALDWEGRAKGDTQMTRAQATEFLDIIENKLGRKAVLYSGNVVKEQVPKPDTFLGSHRLWLCEYGPEPRLPASWQKFWLWQFTGDGIGPKPHKVDGIPVNGLDINHYDGTIDDLAKEWAA